MSALVKSMATHQFHFQLILHDAFQKRLVSLAVYDVFIEQLLQYLPITGIRSAGVEYVIITSCVQWIHTRSLHSFPTWKVSDCVKTFNQPWTQTSAHQVKPWLFLQTPGWFSVENLKSLNPAWTEADRSSKWVRSTVSPLCANTTAVH